jgi:hypothetical protein
MVLRVSEINGDCGKFEILENLIPFFAFRILMLDEILTAQKLAQVGIEPSFEGADADVLPVLCFIHVVPGHWPLSQVSPLWQAMPQER